MKYSFFFIITILTCISSKAQQTVGLFQNDSLAYNGYTLLAPLGSKVTYLIDNCGFVVNEWTSNYLPANSVYLTETGDLYRTCRINGFFSGGGVGGRIEKYDWDGNLIWYFDYADSTQQQHHDIEILPNGNILILSWDYKTSTEATIAGRSNGQAVWSEKIIEIQPTPNQGGTIVWEWYLWDHIIQNADSTKANYGSIVNHPELVNLNYLGTNSNGQGGLSDWIHANAIDYNAELDQIMLSSRHLSELWIIDHSTTTAEAATHTGGNSGKGGDLLYRWGNPQAYGRGTAVDQVFFGQHDAHWIPKDYPDGGKIMVFNNGLNRPDSLYSSIDIIVPPMDANDNYVIDSVQAIGPAQTHWTYTGANHQGTFYSRFISGVQRLPNGNTLICSGANGQIFEIDSLGNQHWLYINPVINGGPVSQGNNIIGNIIFRAERYPINFPAFIGKTLIPLSTIEFNPLPSNCQITSIFAPRLLEGVHVIQNPIFNFLNIKNNANEEISIRLINNIGQTVFSTTTNEVNPRYTINYPKGLYFVEFMNSTKTKRFIQKIIILKSN